MPDYCLRSTTNTVIYQLLFRIAAAAGGVLEVSASDIYISTLVTGWQSTARRPFSRFLFFIAFTSQIDNIDQIIITEDREVFSYH